RPAPCPGARARRGRGGTRGGRRGTRGGRGGTRGGRGAAGGGRRRGAGTRTGGERERRQPCERSELQVGHRLNLRLAAGRPIGLGMSPRWLLRPACTTGFRGSGRLASLGSHIVVGRSSLRLVRRQPRS